MRRSNSTPTIEGYDDAVSRVYEAALSPELWDEVLTRFVNLFAPLDWDVAMLMWEDHSRPGAQFVSSTGLVGHARELYSSHFAGRNPWSEALAAMPVGRVVESEEVVSREELLGSSFYEHFLSNWSLTRAVAINLDRAGDKRLSLAMPGPDFGELTELKRGMRLFAPHLQRAIRISRRLASAELHAQGSQALLSQSPAGVVSLSEALDIINMNDMARELVSNGIAKINDGRWRFSDPSARDFLDTLSRSERPQSSAFTVDDAQGYSYAALAVRMMTQSQSTLDGFMHGAAILLTIGLKGRSPEIPLDNLAAWFGLTPTEARLASALAAGETLSEYAVRRGVSLSAARFLLRGVLRKVDAPDQARLILELKSLPVVRNDRKG